MKVLFWNLGKNSIENYLSQCIKENDVDIALISEYGGIDFKLLRNKLGYGYVHVEGFGGCDKITLIAKNIYEITVCREQDRCVLYRVVGQSSTYIIAGVHLQDRQNSDALARISKIGRIVNDIGNLENSSKCKNTIIIGDFNANPYDDELLAVMAFHAVLFKDVIIKSETRTCNGISYRRFYNPILQFISEDTKSYGSYYYSGGSSSPIWHCLDQVLVSRALANKVNDLKYLKHIKGRNLISRIRPNKEISDHLPLFVSILEGDHEI
ncbi:MAG: endonuclease/exonuclease/phosphatase family protein [Lachnospiraceae bacterium]|nr:endonuclease/exonuclease/phosphatase family protein [Lachnospiraceae bacterium]